MRHMCRGWLWVGVLPVLALAAGCATGSVPPPGEIAPPSSAGVLRLDQLILDPTGGVSGSTPAVSVAELEPTAVEPAPESPPADSQQEPTPPSQARPSSEEEFFDPFARPEEGGLGTVDEYDPFEPWNTRVFTFNRKVDEYLVKPIAKGYNFIMPDVVQRGISNMFVNVRVVPRLLNNIFQGKLKGAGIETSRFLINSTVGIGGFFDPAASYFKLQTPEEDFGQTLGYYGVSPGPYLLLPLWPSPFTIRDGVGYVVDLALDPWNWLVLPFIKIEGAPVLVDDESEAFYANLATRGIYLLNERSLNLETFQGVEEATLDLYSAVRNAYLQRRARAIRE